MSAEAEELELGGQQSASTLELFFDLVFVFVITQLTRSFTEQPSWMTAGVVTLILIITWWMYSGFMWLTNEVAPSTPARRTMLVFGMFGFFAIALSVPDAVHGRGLVFGWAFAGLTVLHALGFRIAGGRAAAKAIGRVLPVNLCAAALVLLGGYLEGGATYAAWGAGAVVLVLVPIIRGPAGFVLRPKHYCERHGAVIIIAIGESIVGVGAGLADVPMDVMFFVEIGLGLGICYVLWWSFFALDDVRGEEALTALPMHARLRPALFAYDYAVLAMVLGIIFTAAGLGMTISHSASEATWPQAMALSGGVGLYLFAQSAFRVILGLPRPALRALAGAIALATIPVGVVGEVWMQLACILVFVYAVIIVDDLITKHSGEHRAYL